MRTLLEVQGHVTATASRSQISYSVLVPEGLSVLYIKFRYAPKVLEDKARTKALVEEAAVKYLEGERLAMYVEQWEKVFPLQNLLTLSLDDPQGYRGAAHRHTPEQEHRIRITDASPGFWPGPIRAGMWRITVSVHAVVTEICTYELQVLGQSKEGFHE
ncbi:hypothetical protein [Paenibacillus aestuarii]|uniref:Uncharacterized protein n=1 Tax=Paenibacillus aestuarii TaxID=516965 RepID=A0ABW0KDR1_9BACL|nr:hypothetical protein [Paenibacillus aestuarii]